jgi:60 kDa SS-A/Ro ribonucleoprotein
MQFATFVRQFRGYGRGLRRGIADWYDSKDADKLAYQLIKYRGRVGWTHRDLMRLSHPKAPTPAHQALYGWVTHPDQVDEAALPELARGFLRAQCAESVGETISLITEYGLPREALRTEHLTDAAVWQALLDAGMPMTALIRNLANMTRYGLLTPTSNATRQVIEQITDGERILRARVHPIAVLAALKTYQAGHSSRGKSTWTPIASIVDALDDSFYASFENVPATGKSTMIGLDVSGSMDMGTIAGVPGLTPRVAAAAMAMVSMSTGDPYEVIGFTSAHRRYGQTTAQAYPGVSVLSLSPKQRLDDVVATVSSLPFGGTDCALPILYAMDAGREVDVFSIYTDNESWAGEIHASQALAAYRQRSDRDAKLVSVGMTATEYSVADPEDENALNVTGFDTMTPQLIAAFTEGAF